MLYTTSAGLYGLATVSRFSQLSGIVQNRSSGITACLVVGTRTIHSPVLLLSSVSTFPSSAAAVLTTLLSFRRRCAISHLLISSGYRTCVSRRDSFVAFWSSVADVSPLVSVFLYFWFAD